MTLDEFYFLIETKTTYEFTFNNNVYYINYGKDDKGNFIEFGDIYYPKKYYSTGELLNNASVENHYFKEIIELLESRKSR